MVSWNQTLVNQGKAILIPTVRYVMVKMVKGNPDVGAVNLTETRGYMVATVKRFKHDDT